jgi:CDP-glycerol glycerophosphotransferase
VVRRALFPVLERVVPADDKLWCFCTWERYPHTLDNPRAVFEAIRADPGITCIVLQKSPGSTTKDSPNVRFVPAESFRGAWYVARSRVILLGYALRGLASYAGGVTTKHVIVHLGHGVMGLRRLGHMFKRETWWTAETHKYSAMIASSERERHLRAEAFQPLPAERIWVTGIPRNDFLLAEETSLPEDYQGWLQELRGLLRGRRLVLYAPTWRDNEASHYRFSDQEIARLAGLLRRHGAVLGIHGHPNIRHKGWLRVDNAPEEILNIGHFPDVTPVLRDTAVLLTDYSSIFIDFMLTGRPIVHFMYDFDEYVDSRTPFLYPPEDSFPGTMSRSFEALLEDLDAALVRGVADPARYNHVRDLFHQHGTDSARVVAEAIRGLVQG